MALNLASFKEGEWQKHQSMQSTRTFAFRAQCARIYNQLNYSFFGETTYFIEAGKDGYLFEKVYSASVCGENFAGHEKLTNQLDSLDRLDQLLKSRGKRLIVLLAPNKYRFFREKVDLDCDQEQTNYDVIRTLLDQKQIETIDCNRLFQDKDATYPLFSKNGTHWSIYGAGQVAKELQNMLVEGGYSDGVLSEQSIEMDEFPRYTDKDLHDLLNIMQLPPKETLAYPTYQWSGQKKPRTLIVGDSYYMTFYYLNLHETMFAADSKFFHYAKEQVGVNPTIGEPLTSEMIAAELDRSDVIILESNEDALSKFGWGFISKAVEMLESEPSL